MTEQARLVYLYLKTCERSHMSGLYQIGIATIAEDLRLEPEAVRETIAEPLAELVEYDSSTREVFVREAGAVEVVRLGKDDNRRPNLERYLLGINSERLLTEFYSTYSESWRLEPQAPYKPLESPSEANSNSKTTTTSIQQQPETAAGLTTEERQHRTSEDVSTKRIVSAARLVAKPDPDHRVVKAWRTWIEEHPTERIETAEGVRIWADHPESGFELGERFGHPEALFQKLPTLREQAQRAWRKSRETSKPRAGDLSRPNVDL